MHTRTHSHTQNAGAQNVVCAAVSDADDKNVVFHITNNVQSSSLLPLAENMSIEYPWIHESEKRNVETIILDTLYARRGLAPDAFDYAHFDIQGAELLALSGARTIIPHLRAIYTEVSVKPLYAGCVLLPEMDAFLATEGFTRVAVSQGITHIIYTICRYSILSNPYFLSLFSVSLSLSRSLSLSLCSTHLPTHTESSRKAFWWRRSAAAPTSLSLSSPPPFSPPSLLSFFLFPPFLLFFSFPPPFLSPSPSLLSFSLFLFFLFPPPFPFCPFSLRGGRKGKGGERGQRREGETGRGGKGGEERKRRERERERGGNGNRKNLGLLLLLYTQHTQTYSTLFALSRGGVESCARRIFKLYT